MKRILTLLILFVSFFYAQAQDTAYLDIGNVRALIHSDGNLFQDMTNGRPAYEVPKGANSFSIYASSFWMSSISQRNNRTHYAAAYESFGFNDLFNVGPVDIVNQQAETSSQFQRLWKVTKAEIDNHIQSWNNPNYVIPASIMDWPGNGGINNATNLAPYEDLDSNNIYEPQKGEYPIIKGDQAVYLILNDYRSESVCFAVDTITNDTLCNYSEGPLKIEMHVMLYAYDTTAQAIANTVFTNVKVYNRSNSSIDDHSDFHFSVYADFDLGNSADDYVGSDTNKNMYFAYNGDLFDDDRSGAIGYRDRLAAQGVLFLENRLSHTTYYNIGNVDNGDPSTTPHYANYQRGMWKNSQPVYYGGDGFDIYSPCVDTTRPTRFMFNGPYDSPFPVIGWTEGTPCPNGGPFSRNAPGDRRMVGGPNIPKQLNHGDMIEIDYAYIFARDEDTSISIYEPVVLLSQTADSVNQFFNNNIAVSIVEVDNPQKQIEFSIYPNPAKNVAQLDVNAKQYIVQLFDLTGSLLQEKRNQRVLNTSDLSEGIYFVRVHTGSSVRTRKLIVSK